jgi:hypothetical protein
LSAAPSISPAGLSPLFVAAQAALAAPLAEQLGRFLDALEAQVPRDDNLCGRLLRRNLQQENQHSESPERADPTLYAAFLRDLCEPPCDLGDRAQLKERYETVCRAHRLSGPAVQTRPVVLLRYVSVDGFAWKIVEALRRSGSRFFAQFDELLHRPEHEKDRWPRILSLLQKADVWRQLPHHQVSLTGHHVMFVTFAVEPAIERTSSEPLWCALALWAPLTSPLLELSLEPPTDHRQLKLPTVADAGWYGWFQSAPPGAPHGMTGPRDPVQSPQPEAVMLPGSLAAVAGPRGLRLLMP